MQANDPDQELRRLFAELRHEDARRSPPFATLLARAAKQQAGRHRRRRLPIARAAGLAAAAAVLLIVGQRLFFRPPDIGPQHDTAISIAAWHSPTGALLVFAGGAAGREPRRERASTRRLAGVGWSSPTASLLRSPARSLRGLPALGNPGRRIGLGAGTSIQ